MAIEGSEGTYWCFGPDWCFLTFCWYLVFVANDVIWVFATDIVVCLFSKCCCCCCSLTQPTQPCTAQHIIIIIFIFYVIIKWKTQLDISYSPLMTSLGDVFFSATPTAAVSCIQLDCLQTNRISTWQLQQQQQQECKHTNMTPNHWSRQQKPRDKLCRAVGNSLTFELVNRS